jgi:uncharacterized membrane protein YhaH (DUF805 family)
MRQLPSLGFIEAVKLASGRIMDFKGRSRRSEFWWWMLLVIISNWVITSFVSNLLVSAIAATIIMFFGLSVTVRRLQDSGKSALWVYISYGLGIVSNILVALSPAMNKLVEEATSGFLNEKSIEKILGNGAGEMLTYSCISILFCIFALIVVIMCLLDSTPGINKYGNSPKYVEKTQTEENNSSV